MGSSDLNSDYTSKSSNPYKLTTQLRNAKQSSQSKHSLMDARTDSSEVKFHGKLETSPDCSTEYDKEELLTSLKEQVYYDGLQNFFAMPTSYWNNVQPPIILASIRIANYFSFLLLVKGFNNVL